MRIRIREKTRSPGLRAAARIIHEIEDEEETSEPTFPNGTYRGEVGPSDTPISTGDFQPSDIVYERLTGRGPYVLVQRKDGRGGNLLVQVDGARQVEQGERTWIAKDKRGRLIFIEEALITHRKPESFWSRVGNFFTNVGKMSWNKASLIFSTIFSVLKLIIWGIRTAGSTVGRGAVAVFYHSIPLGAMLLIIGLGISIAYLFVGWWYGVW